MHDIRKGTQTALITDRLSSHLDGGVFLAQCGGTSTRRRLRKLNKARFLISRLNPQRALLWMMKYDRSDLRH